MSSPARTPRRLPARVYWFRRVLVLSTVLAFVFTGARLLQSEDPDPSASSAAVVRGVPSTAPTTAPSRTTAPRALPTRTAPATPTAPASPDGPCAPNEVIVVPVEGSAAAGRAVPLVLQLTSIRPACTFEVSPGSLAVKVSGSAGKVWSSQDCPRSVRPSTVVVRSAEPISIQVAWSGRRSDGTCSAATEWALPADYRVSAAALGSEPSSATVTLTVPERPVVIRTVTPKPTKAPTKKPTKAPTKKPTTAPTRTR